MSYGSLYHVLSICIYLASKNENLTATISVSLCYIIYLGQVKITLLEATSLGSLNYILRNNN